MGFRRSESGKPAGRNMSSPAGDPPKGLFFFGCPAVREEAEGGHCSGKLAVVPLND